MGPTYSQVWRSKDGSNWTQVTANPGFSTRRFHGVAVYDGKMWVMGGGNGSGGYRGDIWNSSDGENWTQVASSTSWGQRDGLTTLVYKNKLWVIGGFLQNDVWSSVDGKAWTQVTASAQWSKRYDFSAIVFDDKMWVIGGYQVGDAWYSSDGANWTKASSSAGWGNRSAFSLADYNHKLWLCCGTTGDYKKDIWYTESQVNAGDHAFRPADPGQLLKVIGPNPFRDNVQLRFLTSRTSPAQIRIYSGAGREIAILPSGSAGGGERAVTWNGLTNSGAPAPDGTYFVRCRTGGATATQTVVKSGQGR